MVVLETQPVQREVRVRTVQVAVQASAALLRVGGVDEDGVVVGFDHAVTLFAQRVCGGLAEVD